jgi:ribosomal protein L37AE/L43A
MTQRWRCPKCGATVTTHIPLTQPPTCGHAGRYGRRTTPMEPVDATMLETNEPEQRDER